MGRGGVARRGGGRTRGAVLGRRSALRGRLGGGVVGVTGSRTTCLVGGNGSAYLSMREIPKSPSSLALGFYSYTEYRVPRVNILWGGRRGKPDEC